MNIGLAIIESDNYIFLVALQRNIIYWGIGKEHAPARVIINLPSTM